MKARVAALALALASCAHVKREGEVDTLLGLDEPLLPSPALRLVVQGQVGPNEAEVTFDPASQVSFVTSACVPRPNVRARARVPDPFGPDEVYPIARLEEVQVGSLHLAPMEAALADGQTCVLVLGAPELKGLALELDPARRRIKLRPSQAKEAWVVEAEASGDDAQVLTMTRDPKNDWPLLPVRVRQGPSAFEGSMLVSLRDSRSRIFDDAARLSGLKPGLELLEGLPLPEGLTLPPELAKLKGYAFDAFEFAPGFGLKEGSLEVEAGSPAHAPAGMVGADLWGRFNLVYDVGTSVLVLRRPRVFTSGSRTTCARGAQTTEEGCFELNTITSERGIEVTATTWSPLPNGAQLSLDLVGSAGACRVGITFSPGDRGRSTQHRFPWPKMGESLPGCGDAFKGVTSVAPGLLEEGAMRECPGVCAYAKDVQHQRLSCECQPSARTADGALEKKLLEFFREALERAKPAGPAEPKDPD